MIPLVTERLILRSWRVEDRQPFAAMNADPNVMRFFPSVLTEVQSDSIVDRLIVAEERHGMTFYATEEIATGRFIGLIGIMPIPDRMPIAPAIEIGWRLAPEVWRRGLATEGARAVLRLAFEEMGIDRVVAYTAAGNTPSRRVMEKIGLARATELDFDHPDIPEGHKLRRHVVYAVEADAWRKSHYAFLAR